MGEYRILSWWEGGGGKSLHAHYLSSPLTDVFYLSGQMDAVKIMAKDLVRTRRYVKKFMLMKANIQAVSLKIQTLKSQNAMAEAMKVNI